MSKNQEFNFNALVDAFNKMADLQNERVEAFAAAHTNKAIADKIRAKGIPIGIMVSQKIFSQIISGIGEIEKQNDSHFLFRIGSFDIVTNARFPDNFWMYIFQNDSIRHMVIDPLNGIEKLDGKYMQMSFNEFKKIKNGNSNNNMQ